MSPRRDFTSLNVKVYVTGQPDCASFYQTLAEKKINTMTDILQGRAFQNSRTSHSEYKEKKALGIRWKQSVS